MNQPDQFATLCGSICRERLGVARAMIAVTNSKNFLEFLCPHLSRSPFKNRINGWYPSVDLPKLGLWNELSGSSQSALIRLAQKFQTAFCDLPASTHTVFRKFSTADSSRAVKPSSNLPSPHFFSVKLPQYACATRGAKAPSRSRTCVGRRGEQHRSRRSLRRRIRDLPIDQATTKVIGMINLHMAMLWCSARTIRPDL